MPRRRRRPRKGARGSKLRKSPAPSQVVSLAEPKGPDLHEVLRALTGKDEKKDDWVRVGTRTPKDVALPLLRTLFKADNPFRTKVAYSGTFATTAAGLLNFQAGLSTIVSGAEWSSLAVLFDELFVHQLTFRYWPVNDLGGGSGYYTTGGGTQPTGTLNTGASTTVAVLVSNAPVVWVSIFSSTSLYTTADSMLDNPTRGYRHTARAHSYVWRNNQRFDPRGLCIPTVPSQGWTLVSAASGLAGTIQCRAVGDQTFGDTAHIVVCGRYTAEFDVSFRQRL